MLNSHVEANDPFAGLDLHERTGSSRGTLAGLTAWFHRRIEQWRCAKLRRETAHAIAKLDDRTLSDIGWPGRFEAQDPCAKA